jgi:NADH-quinone oxidoreductase subunit F
VTTVSPQLTSAADLARWREAILAARAEHTPRTVTVCLGTGCSAKGAARVYAALQAAVRELPEEQQVTLRTTGCDSVHVTMSGCHGFCERGPLVVVSPPELFYQLVKEEDVPELVQETLVHGRPVARLLAEAPDGTRVYTSHDLPFYQKQMRLVLRDNGVTDPESLEDYVARGGYASLAKALTQMTPEQVLHEVEISGLRGRGGGGFPTGRKWRSCREAQGEPKYVLCNGDEGDPGAFMDRSLMEANPHAILEGMIIGAYAIGASQGFIYVRNEYPLAVVRLRKALEAARDAGLLGERLLGADFSFDIRISRGGGAFVCGESTALMTSLEGRAGEPRAKYVHTVEVGLHSLPTTLNNVETWANIPAIIERGGAWFASIGTERSKGTKVFSLVGKVRNTGLVEVPMGMTLREIVFDIGGGIAEDRAFKAVQTGGPSGGCIPASFLDTPVDYDQLTRLGSMMGSGGLIVMDEDTCMVNLARYFLTFLEEESCGKCTTCREGTTQLLHILTAICEGRGKEGDVELLLELSEVLEEAALCGLGNTACNPVRSTIRYFREEYDAHIRDRHCPAHECRGLFRYEIVADQCKGCLACAKECPQQAIAGERRQPHTIDQSKCVFCGACFSACRFDAVAKV